jgi:hypothetical protein
LNNIFEKGDFGFWMPVEAISKSMGAKDGKRYIQGIASTDAIDLQQEKVIQSGIDFSYFASKGHINNDHLPGPENKVGEPVEVRMTKQGLWIKAFLYKGHERAEYWWNLLQAKEQSGSNRPVGFSIQGKVIARQGKTILKCWIQDVAITASPVNTTTWAEIVKSFCAMQAKEKEEKSLTTASGDALIPESLDRTKFLSKSQTIQTLIEKGYSKVTAKIVADSLFLNNGAG